MMGSRPTPDQATMSQEEYLLLNEVIEHQFGLSFPPSKKEFLEFRLRPRLQARHLRRFIDYYLLLQYDMNGEVEHLARAVTNNETYFFRETYQFEALFEEALVPLQAETGRDVRILCAGCSSGEEPYTMNVFALEAARRTGIRCTIDAFDIDLERLELARAGRYGRTSMRAATPEQKARYFVSLGDERWEIRPALRPGIRFSRGNILELSSFRDLVPYDVVFCRNVLIYFSEASFQRAVANFALSLRSGGLFFLGHSESIIGRTELFSTERIGRCIAYRRVSD